MRNIVLVICHYNQFDYTIITEIKYRVFFYTWTIGDKCCVRRNEGLDDW